MIGIDQEPSRDALDKLNGALGEGKYSVEYRETPGGVAIIVQTREVPARVWSSQVASGAARASVDGVWSELTSRVVAESKPTATPTTTGRSIPEVTDLGDDDDDRYPNEENGDGLTRKDGA